MKPVFLSTLGCSVEVCVNDSRCFVECFLLMEQFKKVIKSVTRFIIFQQHFTEQPRCDLYGAASSQRPNLPIRHCFNIWF